MPWSPGTSLAGLFNLYPSLGTVTLAADLATTLDGPIQVYRYGALTINTARTVTNRCRGLMILCDSLTMGASGALSMTGKGAAGTSNWINQNITIPPNMTFTGKDTERESFFAYLAAKGYFIGDPTMYAIPPTTMGDVQSDYTSWPMSAVATSTTSKAMVTSGSFVVTVQTGLALVAGNRVTVYNSADTTKWMSGTVASYVTGTGVLTVTVTAYAGTGTFATWAVVPAPIIAAGSVGASMPGVAYPAVSGVAGSTGGAGSNAAPGGGGTGGVFSASAGAVATARSAPGTVWGGGPGSGGMYAANANVVGPEPDMYGSAGGASTGNGDAGGGAGNPGGAGAVTGLAGATGTGGVLIIIVRGAVTLTALHALTAHGMDGGNGVAVNSCGGGASGGGSVSLIYSGALAGTPNLVANGGAAGTGSVAGGPAGAGSTQVRTFTEMGW